MGINIFKPTLEDLDKIVAIEKASWPDNGKRMVMDKEDFATRITLGLMYLAEVNGEPAGIISFQYPAFMNGDKMEELLDEYYSTDLLNWDKTSKKYQLPKDWYDATNNGRIVTDTHSTHDSNSDCVYLIGVGVSPEFRGNGLVSKLIRHTLVEGKKQGKVYTFGYGRLLELHKQKKFSLREAEQYLLERKPNTNLPRDFGARFHERNNAKCLSVIPNSMEDPESQNYGVLVLYDLASIVLTDEEKKSILHTQLLDRVNSKRERQQSS